MPLYNIERGRLMWTKPDYKEIRLGFEITMYVMTC